MFKASRGIGLVVLVVLALALTATVYAFAAANVVPESGAGDGAEVISGYTITAVTYTPDGTDPSKIDAVQFAVAPTASAQAPTSVKVQLISSGAWFGCSNTSGTTWSCDIASAVTVAAANNLRVVAVQ